MRNEMKNANTLRIEVEDVDPLIRHANYFKLASEEGSWEPRKVQKYELIHIVAGEFAHENLLNCSSTETYVPLRYMPVYETHS